MLCVPGEVLNYRETDPTGRQWSLSFPFGQNPSLLGHRWLGDRQKGQVTGLLSEGLICPKGHFPEM